MEPWMIDKMKREQENAQERIPLYIQPTPPEFDAPGLWSDPAHREDESRRGYCIID